jgi:hypothetical protein
MADCGICKRSDTERPQIFKGRDWCSTNHQKMLLLGEKEKEKWIQNYLSYVDSNYVVPPQQNNRHI